jgi:hypothetical protein
MRRRARPCCLIVRLGRSWFKKTKSTTGDLEMETVVQNNPAAETDEECKHGLVRAWCSLCTPRSAGPRTNRTSRHIGSTQIETMHFLIKWNPEREADTLQRHLDVAKSKGTSWWACVTSSKTRRAAPERVDTIQRQLAQGRTTVAFWYKTGAAPEQADVWQATVIGVTAAVEEVDPTHRPSGFSLSPAYLYVELSDFEQVPSGWVTRNLELWDQPGRLLDGGALRNQASPLYVCVREHRSTEVTP